MDNKENTNVWFITGASQGFGLYLTRLVLSNGDKVAATTRNTDRLLSNLDENSEQLLPVTLDITQHVYMLGYEYSQSFNKFFKKNTDLSPLAFRNQFRKN